MRTKLVQWIVLIVVVALTGAMPVYTLFNLERQVGSHRLETVRNFDLLSAGKDMVACVHDGETARAQLLATHDLSDRERLQSTVARLRELFVQVQQDKEMPKELIEHLRVLTDRWIADQALSVSRISAVTDKAKAPAGARSRTDRSEELVQALDSFIMLQHSRLDASKLRWYDDIHNRDRVLTYVALGFIILVLIIASIPVHFLPQNESALRRLSLQLAVTNILANADSVGSASTEIVQTICDSFGFVCGAVWLMDPDDDKLHAVATWATESLVDSEFMSITREIRYSSGVGVPGLVWSTGCPHWVDGAVEHENFPRIKYAKEVCVHAAVGFPIRSTGRILGTLEFYSNSMEQKKPETMDLLASLGEEIGQSFESLMNRSQIVEDNKLATFVAETSETITTEANTDMMLRRCSDLMVRHLNAALARIWLIEEEKDVLVLKTSSGMYSHTNGAHGRIRLGQYKIGMIGQERQPHLTNDVDNDPQISNHEWTKREGIVAFAGYPLLVDGELVGVMGMFSRQPLSQQVLKSLGSVSNEIAIAVRHRRSEAQLIQSERLFRRLAENIREVFFVVHPGVPLTYVSPAYDDVWGRPWQVLMRHPLSLLATVDKEDRARVARFISHDMKIEAGQIEFRILKPDGTSRWIWLRNFPKFDANGAWKVSYSVAQDISERKEAESRINDFFSTVSHELRTPLTSIHASLRLMQGGLAGPLSEKGSQLVNIATTESSRLIRLINDILDLRKMEAGKLELKTGEVSTRHLMELAVSGVKGIADDAGVAIHVHDVDGYFVWCDEDRIVQVMENLLSNAIKFSPRQSTVDVSLSCEAEMIRFSIADKGSGIPQASLSKLFCKFKQLDSSDARPKGGTGLGLAISKAIVVQHHGRIGVFSKENQGSTFWFELPKVAKGQNADVECEGAPEIFSPSTPDTQRMQKQPAQANAGWVAIDQD